MSDPQLQLNLIGPWQAFDPDRPLPGAEYAELLQELTVLGWLPPPSYPDVRLALAATMIVPDPEPGVLPLFASLSVHERRGRFKIEFSRDGAIVPRRRQRTFDTDWPALDVGGIRLHQLTYDIPLPRSDCYYSIAFTTPNLTRLPELELVFDAIVSTAAWVEEIDQPSKDMAI